MYKVVTVNCSSQYSGCKCIWTFHYCHKSGINITDISYRDCKISWMSFCPIIFAKLPHDIKQRKCVWCVFMYSMFSAIDVRLDPNDALHGSDQSNTSLWADEETRSAYIFSFCLSFIQKLTKRWRPRYSMLEWYLLMLGMHFINKAIV